MREFLVIPQHALKECFFKAISQYSWAIHTMKKKKIVLFWECTGYVHISAVSKMKRHLMSHFY